MLQIFESFVIKLLDVLADPAVLTTLGSLAAASAASFSKRVRAFILSLGQRLKKKAAKVEDEAKLEVRATIHAHVVTANTLKSYTTIVVALESIKRALQADRVTVCQFHNGSKFTDANPMLKVDCTYEAVSAGLRLDAKAIKDISLGHMTDLVYPLISNGTLPAGVSILYRADEDSNEYKHYGVTRVVRYDIEDMLFTPFRFLEEQQGVAVLYTIPMFGAADKTSPIGFFTIQYSEKEEDKVDKETIVPLVSEHVQRIAYILTHLSLDEEAKMKEYKDAMKADFLPSGIVSESLKEPVAKTTIEEK